MTNLLQTFFGYPYCVWNIDLTEFKSNTSFDKELDEQFRLNCNEINSKAPQGIGDACSINLSKFNNLPNLLNLVSPSLNEKLKLFNVKPNKNLRRCWANRLLMGSSGIVHNHAENQLDILVLILYYNIPINSGELIFVNPKYKGNEILDRPDEIMQEDVKRIAPTEGLCILHHGSLLHGVLTHKSDKPRDSLIIEFNTF